MVSACLIVLNEEKRIAKVINNIKKYVDEIIVIDGGSADKTVKIAVSLGAKVFKRKWDNNFGAQRNFAIKKAKGNWIFIIDADETGSIGLLRSLRKFSNSDEVDGYGFTRKNYINKKLDRIENTKINLFKRQARYKEKIHEQPVGLKRVLIIYDKDIYLNHYKTDGDQMKHLMNYYQIVEDNLRNGVMEARKRKYNKLLEITKKDMEDIVKKHNINKEILSDKFKKLLF